MPQKKIPKKRLGTKDLKLIYRWAPQRGMVAEKPGASKGAHMPPEERLMRNFKLAKCRKEIWMKQAKPLVDGFKKIFEDNLGEALKKELESDWRRNGKRISSKSLQLWRNPKVMQRLKKELYLQMFEGIPVGREVIEKMVNGEPKLTKAAITTLDGRHLAKISSRVKQLKIITLRLVEAQEDPYWGVIADAAGHLSGYIAIYTENARDAKRNTLNKKMSLAGRGVKASRTK